MLIIVKWLLVDLIIQNEQECNRTVLKGLQHCNFPMLYEKRFHSINYHSNFLFLPPQLVIRGTHTLRIYVLKLIC